MTDQRKKQLTIIGLLTLVITIAVVSLLTVYKLRQLGTRPVAPNAPESKPAAYVPPSCKLEFTVAPLACYQGTCTSNSQCGQLRDIDLSCQTATVSGQTTKTCVNPDCPEESTCECLNPTPTPTPTPTPAPACYQNDCTISPNNCPSGLTCQNVTVDDETVPRCVNTSCPSETDCACQEEEYSCDSYCTDTSQCQTENENYICSSNRCRHKDYTSEADCTPPDVTYSCDSTCTDTSQCQTANSNYICYQNKCRHQDYLSESDCTPSTTSYSCNSSCSSDSQCQTVNSNYVCLNGYCRNSSCSGETDCTCSIAATPTPTPAPVAPGSPAQETNLPQAGNSLPTLGVVGTGGFLLILGIVGLLLL